MDVLESMETGTRFGNEHIQKRAVGKETKVRNTAGKGGERLSARVTILEDEGPSHHHPTR